MPASFYSILPVSYTHLGSRGTTCRHGIMGRLVLWEGMKGWLKKQLQKRRYVALFETCNTRRAHAFHITRT